VTHSVATSGGATAKLVQGQCGQLYLAQDNEQISPPRTAGIMQSRLQLAGLDLFLDSSLPPQGVQIEKTYLRKIWRVRCGTPVMSGLGIALLVSIRNSDLGRLAA
jgi:hypothetical protein